MCVCARGFVWANFNGKMVNVQLCLCVCVCLCFCQQNFLDPNAWSFFSIKFYLIVFASELLSLSDVNDKH